MLPLSRTALILIVALLFAALIFASFLGAEALLGLNVEAAVPAVEATAEPTLSHSSSPTVLALSANAEVVVTPTPFQPLPPTPAVYPFGSPSPTVTEPPASSTPTSPPIVIPTDQGVPSIISQPPRQVNILLLGSDQRPWDTIFRTDTIILATLNTESGTVNLTSFPRDLYVTLPGWGMNRINTAYQFGGFGLLADTFEANFGVRPDHYVLVNFRSFKQTVDSLGGLDVQVEESVSDYRDGYWVTIPAGEVHMDADTVLWYVRSRKTTNDFARNRRQQEVLNALIRKFFSMDGIKRVPEFYELYRDNVTTDITLKEIVPLLPLAAKITDTTRIHRYSIGPDAVWDWFTPDGGMVLLPRPEVVAEIMRQALNAP